VLTSADGHETLLGYASALTGEISDAVDR